MDICAVGLDKVSFKNSKFSIEDSAIIATIYFEIINKQK